MPPIEVTQRCRGCTRDLPAAALVCPQCRTLVHSEELDRVAASAKDFEAKSQPRAAHDRWMEALALLPRDSQQAEWIRGHAKALLRQALDSEAAQQKSKWAKKLGPLGPVAVLAAKAKTVLLLLFKLKFLLSLAAFVAVYWAFMGTEIRHRLCDRDPDP